MFIHLGHLGKVNIVIKLKLLPAPYPEPPVEGGEGGSCLNLHLHSCLYLMVVRGKLGLVPIVEILHGCWSASLFSRHKAIKVLTKVDTHGFFLYISHNNPQSITPCYEIGKYLLARFVTPMEARKLGDFARFR